MFFDDHPEVLETSNTASSLSRLNLRHLGIIEENRDVFPGSTVVDIASHDGRWSFAALQAGAKRVIDIEGRKKLIEHTENTFAAKGVDPTRYDLIRGDVHAELFNPLLKADVVMCLGFLYHTARYVELMAGIAATGAKHVIVDTRVLQDVKGPLVEMRTEGTIKQSVALRDKFAQGRRVISAIPSEAAVELMLNAIGYDVDHRTDWNRLLASQPDPRGVGQYLRGQRVTFRATKVEEPTPEPQ